MTTLQFPNTYDNFVRLGLEAYEAENYQQALTNFSQAYQLQPNFEIHQFMLRCYLSLENYDEAKKLLLEKKSSYLKSSDGLKLYFDLLCKTKEWITAHILIVQYPELHVYQEQLAFLEQDDYTYRTTYYEKLQLKLQTSLQSEPMEQLLVYKQANFLTLDLYYQIIIPLLNDQQLFLLVRAYLLDSLRALNYESEVSYLDLQQKSIQCRPSQLKERLHDTDYLALEQEIARRLAKEPHNLVQIKGLLPLIYYLLLPKPDEYLHNYQAFAAELLIQFGVWHQAQNNDSDEKIKQIISEIQKLLTKLH